MAQINKLIVFRLRRFLSDGSLRGDNGAEYVIEYFVHEKVLPPVGVWSWKLGPSRFKTEMSLLLPDASVMYVKFHIFCIIEKVL